MSFNEGRCWTILTISERRIRHAWRCKHKDTKPLSRKQTSIHPGTMARASRRQRSFENDHRAKNTSAAAGNLILMSQKQNTNKTKATVLWKHALSYIQILPHLSAQACQNCSLSLPLQDYRQSARDKTHTRLINANAFIVRTGNKQKPERHPFG